MGLSRTLRLCTYNSRGAAADRIAYINRLLQNCDVLLIQEHWLYQDDLHKLCADADHLVTGVSAMDAGQLRLGRPHGGCAVLYKKSLNCTVSPLETKSRRLHACILTLSSGLQILIFNVYMPCDTTFDVENEHNFTDVLTEIECLINIHCDVDIVIVGGDFNTDVSRPMSLHRGPLTEFCARQALGMCLNVPSPQVDFTYVNSATGAKSVLDHFIVSHNVFNCVSRYVVLHDGDNLSDHHPVQLELCIDVEYSTCCQAQPSPRPAWHRAGELHLQRYREHLRNELLMRVEIPTEALACRTFNCSDHLVDLKVYYAALMKALASSANACIPARRKKAMAGWSEHVADRKEKAIFWHSMWLSGGQVRGGWLHAIMLEQSINACPAGLCEIRRN